MIVTLFHRCYYSYLKGNLEQARIFMDFLRDEFKNKGKKEDLNEHQLRLLKKVRDAIQGKYISDSIWSGELKDPPKYTKNKETEKRHSVLVKMIHDQIDDLKRMIGENSKEFRLENIEHPCPPYGRIDMLYKDEVFVYPIEVKPSRGDHDIVGQILKYEKYCRLNLHMRLWEDVKPATICRGYSDFAYQELKRRGIKTLVYQPLKNGISLAKA